MVGVGEEAPLGDLEGEPARLQSGGRERRRNRLCESGLPQVTRGEIHRHSDLETVPLPAPAGLNRGLEGPAGDLMHEIARLRERDEIARQEQAQLRVLPARQRLGTPHATGRELDLGLEVDLELVAAAIAPQVRQERQARRTVGVDLGGVDAVAAARVLRGVHRDVGAAHERQRVGAVLRTEHDADGRADGQLLVLDGERFDERGEERAGRPRPPCRRRRDRAAEWRTRRRRAAPPCRWCAGGSTGGFPPDATARRRTGGRRCR